MAGAYRYRRLDTMGEDDYFEFKTNFGESNGEWLAEAAADDYHSHHDGWEAAWPIQIVVMRNDGSVIGKYEVDRESVPQFSATEVE